MAQATDYDWDHLATELAAHTTWDNLCQSVDRQRHDSEVRPPATSTPPSGNESTPPGPRCLVPGARDAVAPALLLDLLTDAGLTIAQLCDHLGLDPIQLAVLLKSPHTRRLLDAARDIAAIRAELINHQAATDAADALRHTALDPNAPPETRRKAATTLLRHTPRAGVPTSTTKATSTQRPLSQGERAPSRDAQPSSRRLHKAGVQNNPKRPVTPGTNRNPNPTTRREPRPETKEPTPTLPAMKHHGALCVTLFATSVSLLGCGEQPANDNTAIDFNDSAQTYRVRGVIVQTPSKGPPPRDLKIHHEHIPDFIGANGKVYVNKHGVPGMAAMVMPFPEIAEGVSLEGLEQGDKIAFEFKVNWVDTPGGGRSPRWLVSAIEPLPADAEISYENKVGPATTSKTQQKPATPDPDATADDDGP